MKIFFDNKVIYDKPIAAKSLVYDKQGKHGDQYLFAVDQHDIVPDVLNSISFDVFPESWFAIDDKRTELYAAIGHRQRGFEAWLVLRPYMPKEDDYITPEDKDYWEPKMKLNEYSPDDIHIVFLHMEPTPEEKAVMTLTVRKLRRVSYDLSSVFGRVYA